MSDTACVRVQSKQKEAVAINQARLQLKHALSPVSARCEDASCDETSGWKVRASDGALNTSNPIREIIETMNLAENPGKKVIPLSIGDPTIFGNLKPCKEILDAIQRANMSGKYYGYQTAAGMEVARGAVADYHYKCTGNRVGPQDVILASGCSHAIDLCICVLARHGQNILIPRPGFPLYKTLTSVYGVRYKQYNLIAEKNWSIDLKHLESLIDDQTAAIVINNPSNPCGSVFSERHLKQILRLAEKHQLPIISDEIYDKFVFSPDVYEDTKEKGQETKGAGERTSASRDSICRCIKESNSRGCEQHLPLQANIENEQPQLQSQPIVNGHGNKNLSRATDKISTCAKTSSSSSTPSSSSSTTTTTTMTTTTTTTTPTPTKDLESNVCESGRDICIRPGEDQFRSAKEQLMQKLNGVFGEEKNEERQFKSVEAEEGQERKEEVEHEDERDEEGQQFRYVPFQSLASLSETVPILTCGGISKTCLIPGLRLGWIIINDRQNIFDQSVRNGLGRLTQRLMGPNSLVQGALQDILTNVPDHFYKKTMDFIFQNAKLCYERLLLVKGLRPYMPQGSMYLMVRFEPKMFPTINGDLDFTSQLMNQESVLVLPGKCFDFPNFFRVCLTVPTNVMEEALNRIREFCERNAIELDNCCDGTNTVQNVLEIKQQKNHIPLISLPNGKPQSI